MVQVNQIFQWFRENATFKIEWFVQDHTIKGPCLMYVFRCIKSWSIGITQPDNWFRQTGKIGLKLMDMWQVRLQWLQGCP